AGALLMPPGVDCVTLPALRRDADGGYNPRFLLDVSDGELIALRTRVIRSAMEVFDPDLLVVDYLPLGVPGELAPTLEFLKRRCPRGGLPSERFASRYDGRPRDRSVDALGRSPACPPRGRATPPVPRPRLRPRPDPADRPR